MTDAVEKGGAKLTNQMMFPGTSLKPSSHLSLLESQVATKWAHLLFLLVQSCNYLGRKFSLKLTFRSDLFTGIQDTSENIFIFAFSITLF